jgi:uncharacterized protein
MNAPYEPMRDFRRPALQDASLGPVLIVLVVMELVFALGPALPLLFMTQSAAEAYELGATPFAVIQQLLTFGIFAWALTLLVRKLHGRGFWSMVGPPVATVVNIKAAGWSVFLLLLVQAFLPPWIDMSTVAEVRPILPWLLWIPITVAALVVQTGMEELYFRGYLQQQFAALSDNRWVWMGVPSFLFGIGHYMNAYGPADGVLYVIWATALGLACADLTARTGNIGAAIGLHISNNLFAFVVSGVQGWPSSGLALLLFPYDDPMAYNYSLSTLLAPWAFFEILLMCLSVYVMWLAARIGIKR